MRRSAPRPVAAALDRITSGLAPATLLAEVQRAWPAAAGAVFATTCEPTREAAGTVTVECESAVLAQELDLLAELVVNRLNEALGRPEVKRLRPQPTRAAR